MSAALYLETSALLSWLFGEPASPEVIEALESYDPVVSSVLSVVETGRALVRAEAEGIITAGDHKRLQGMFAEYSYGWNYLQVIPSVRQRAAQPFPVEPIRTLDAIHLASAIELLALYPDLVVLSFDKRIRDNLVPLGLKHA